MIVNRFKIWDEILKLFCHLSYISRIISLFLSHAFYTIMYNFNILRIPSFDHFYTRNTYYLMHVTIFCLLSPFNFLLSSTPCFFLFFPSFFSLIFSFSMNEFNNFITTITSYMKISTILYVLVFCINTFHNCDISILYEYALLLKNSYFVFCIQ